MTLVRRTMAAAGSGVRALMQVLGFGTYDASAHPRVGVLFTGLRRRGVTVAEVNAPLGFSTAERVAMTRSPLLGYRFVLRLLRRWATLVRLGRRVARRAGADAVLVGYLGHFDVVLARLLFPRTPIVLDQLIFAADTARDRQIAGGAKLLLLRCLDRLAVRCADVVLVDTEEQLQLLPSAQRGKGVVVAVGAPYEWFVARQSHAGATGARPSGQPLQAVFFGLFTPLQGAPVIAEAIASLPPEVAIRVTFIGAGQDLEQVRTILGSDPRVQFRSWVDPSDLPDEVVAHDVCLGIFSTTPKGQRVVPNKVFQGAAAGCALVTSDTAAQRRALGDAALFVAPGDSAALAATLTALVADPALVETMRTRACERAESDFRPERVVQPLLDALRRPHG